MTTSLDPRVVALQYIEAVGRKDFEAVAALLHPDVEVRLTAATISGAAAYLAALRRVAPIIERNDVHSTIVDGDQVCIVYDFVTDTPVGPVPTVEWLTVPQGRIREARVLFSKDQWPLVVTELRQRSPAAEQPVEQR